MARRPDPVPLLGLEEYLRFEEASPVRHEYVAGRVYAMSGVTIRHAVIAGNVFAAIRGAARGRACRALMNDVKLQAARDVVYYPDVMVTCEPTTMDQRIVPGPCLVVEVTSPSTWRIDHGEKLLAYRQVASLRTYLVVEQSERRVEHHWRDEVGTWQHATITDAAAGGAIPIPCLGSALTLNEIYEGVTFEPPDHTPADGLRRIHEAESAYEVH